MEIIPTRIIIPISPPQQIRITDFGKLFTGLVSFLLLTAFILAFFYLILGGISWLTSGGDKGNVENARNKIIAAIVGLVIVASTWAIFNLVGGALGFNILGGFEIPKLYNDATPSSSLVATPSGTIEITSQEATPSPALILPSTGI